MCLAKSIQILCSCQQPGALGIQDIQEAELAELKTTACRFVRALRSGEDFLLQRLHFTRACLQLISRLQYLRAKAYLFGLGLHLRGVQSA